MNRNSCTNAFVIFTLALGTLFAAQAQEVDADALMATLNAEIKKVDDGEKDAAPQKVASVKDDVAEESAEEATSRAAETRETKALNEAVVTAVGKGETKEEAKLAAFRAAVEKAVGLYVDAESLMENSELIKDRVNTISNADIQKYETLKESRMKSGMYFCQIKAWVEKKAIAPKFADMFPAAFANVSEAAETIHVQKVTRTKRSADAASLMTGALENVDRMRNWVRLSVAKGKGLEEVTKIKRYRGGQDLDVAEVPGKGLYAVRYSMKIDMDAYFKGFVPHFKQTLEKMQEGEAEEDVALTSGPVPNLQECDVCEAEDGCKLVMSGIGCGLANNALRPFVGMERIGGTYFVDPIALDGFPATAIAGGLRGRGGNPSCFMFDQYKGLAKIQEDRTYNIWLLDKMNKSKTSVRCSAYKVPAAALRAYWKALYGDADSEYVRMRKESEAKPSKMYEKVEVVLLDNDGEEVASTVDQVPTSLLSCGATFENQGRRKGPTVLPWAMVNVFESFFIRPMFIQNPYSPYKHDIFYSTEIQRDVYFPLTDSQLAEVKQVKVRFAGGRRAKSNAGSSDNSRNPSTWGRPTRRDGRR